MIILEPLKVFSGDVLCTSVGNAPCIEVRQLDRVRWMHFGNDAVQGCMLLDSPHQLVLIYTQAMLAGLLFVDSPQRLLNLGLGCGSFDRFFRTMLPALKVDSVDHCEQVINFAKRYFQMEENRSVVCESAEVFVATSDSFYDVIFCDLHTGDGPPSCLFDAAFYNNCYERLCAHGVMVINLLITDENEMLVLLQAVNKHFDTLALMAVPDHKNTILFAIKAPFPDEQVLVSRAQQLQPVIQLDLSPYITQFRVLAGAF